MLAPVIVRDLDVDDTAKWPQRSTTSAIPVTVHWPQQFPLRRPVACCKMICKMRQFSAAAKLSRNQLTPDLITSYQGQTCSVRGVRLA